MRPLTDQERLWAGAFGSDYTRRNGDPRQVANNVALFSRVLARTSGISSVLEFGANVGYNLDALSVLLPNAAQTAVEIHPDAADACARHGRRVINASILDAEPGVHDLAFTKGVLIHINPADLPAVYEKLYECSARWIVIAEYANPQPYSVEYRGVKDALHKRDFCGEMMDRYPLTRVDYGFVDKRDAFPQDWLTYYTFEKVG